MKKVLVSTYLCFFSLCVLSQTINVTGINSPSCYGQCNGDISFSITGASGPFSVSITNTLGCINPVIPSFTNTNVTFSNMCSCQYFFTFYDGASSIIGTQAVSITQPNVLILNTSPDPVICYGQTTQIYASGSGGTSPYTYIWNPSSLIGAGPHVLSPTVTTQYTVSVSDANGCITAPQIITANVSPSLSAFGVFFHKCDGSISVLTPIITSPGNGGPYSYNWSDGSTTNSIVVTATYTSSPNLYTVAISDGCTVPSAAAHFSVIVDPTPTFTPILSPATCSTCCDGSVQLAVAGGTGSCTFYLNPGEITTPTAGSLCPGAYGYAVTNSYGCQSNATFTLGSTIGIKEVVSRFEFNIYPNPSDGNIRITSSQEIFQLNYEVYDVAGNKINSGKISDKINIGPLSDGMYILEIKKAEGVILGRQKINIKH